MKTNVCYLGDCLNILPTLPDNSVDSIVTDPPYELGFMGKSWDNSGIAYSVPMWKECLRILKPGGHLLSFSGTRTYHRMAVAIEDAGFEVRDMIEWVYGSGFPKSHNIGKAVDKLQGNERESVGIVKGAGAGMSDSLVAMNKGLQPEYEGTKGTSKYEGWGTALKPAHEPICLARKPLEEKTVAENVLKYGTGGINIDESRVGTEEMKARPSGVSSRAYQSEETTTAGGMGEDKIGRFPANLIHDNSEEVRECFPETKSSKGSFKKEDYSDNKNGSTNFKRGDFIGRDDAGSASRFFKSIIYQAKASKSERNKGLENLEEQKTNDGRNKEIDNAFQRGSTLRNNFHPTVKPIALMEYLIKMITPKDGVVLEPFAGSGSTLVAAKDNGFQYIGIEMTEEYIPIIQARTGCEIIKHSFYSTKGIDEEIKQQEEDNIKANKELDIKHKINLKICPKCNGKIKGRYCEDCLEEYN